MHAFDGSIVASISADRTLGRLIASSRATIEYRSRIASVPFFVFVTLSDRIFCNERASTSSESAVDQLGLD